MAAPVLFVPGLACTGRLFDSQVETLSRERTVILANQRRHDALGEMAGAILAESPERFVLVGLSMGGYVAFEIMRRAPRRVAALVLMDTTARPDGDEARERRHRLIEIAQSGRFQDVVGMQIPNLVAPERVADAALVGVVRDMAAATGVEAYVRQQRAIMGRPDSRPDLAGIACPTLVLVGDRDQITPPALAEEIAGAISGARLTVVPDSGHLSSLERPAAVDDALTRFLSDVNV